MRVLSSAIVFAFLLSCISAFAPLSSFVGTKLESRAATSPECLTMRTRICDLTGKKANRKARIVTFSHKRIHKVQGVNLHTKKFYVESLRRIVKMRVSAKALRIIDKLGLENAARKYNVNLSKF